MAYPRAERLVLPITPYRVDGRAFGEEGVFGGQPWGLHLGEDVYADPGTPVVAAGDGEVVYAALHAGNRHRGNWGNVIILGHIHREDGEPLFSVYGHLGSCAVSLGEIVRLGTLLGPVGEGRTPENGFWPEPHLHFALYRGPWEGRVLPGYFREDDGRTKLEYWIAPAAFVHAYAKPSLGMIG